HERHPSDPQSYINLAACYRALDRLDNAFETLRTGIECCSATEALYRACISALKDMNRTGEAIEVAREAVNAHPSRLLFKFRQRLLLPILYERPQDVDSWRSRYQSGLGELGREVDLTTTSGRQAALDAISHFVPFFLAYQGRDDRELQVEYG